MLFLPYWLSGMRFRESIIAFLIMHLFQSIFLLCTFFITHHTGQTQYFATDKNGRIAASWLENQIYSSNDFYPFSEVANFIFGGFNNHIAHHLFPDVNHVHYPAINRKIYPILKSYGMVPNRTTYLGGVIDHLKHLRQMGRHERPLRIQKKRFKIKKPSLPSFGTDMHEYNY
jgi:linoleoyl-CoA desaturase